jgi:hypothetical protein
LAVSLFHGHTLVVSYSLIERVLYKTHKTTAMNTEPNKSDLRYIMSLRNGHNILSVNQPDYDSDSGTYSFGEDIVYCNVPNAPISWIKGVYDIDAFDVMFMGEFHI